MLQRFVIRGKDFLLIALIIISVYIIISLV